MSIYTPLPEPCISCGHVAYRSPLLLRLEAGHDTAHVMITEHQDRLPFITMDGDATEANWLFGDAITSLRLYLDQHFMIELPKMDLQTRWTIDLRRPTYQALLSELVSDEHYRLLVFGKHDNGRIRADLEETYERLTELYRTFWP